MKGKDWGFALFMGVGVGLSTFLTYLAGHCDGWLDGYGECMKFTEEALKDTTEITENK